MDQTLHQLGELLLGAVPTVILLGLLYILYSLIVHKPLQKVLAERRAKTEGAVEQSRADIAAADSRTAEYEQKIREARASVFKAQEARRQAASQARANAVAEARNRAQKQVADAKKAIAKAEAALAAKDYETFDSWSRAAWGYESRAYPNVTKTQQDVVNGVIFYLALMIPFAYFLERLWFGFSDLKRQLLTASIIFVVVFSIFAVIHPAFKITLNAGIILLSFVMLVFWIGCITMSRESQRLERKLGVGTR